MVQKKFTDTLKEAGEALLGKRQGHNWRQTAGEMVNQTSESLKGLGTGTLTGTADRFNEILPYLERAGFQVIELEVGIGLSPKVTAHLEMIEDIPEEEEKQLLQEVAKSKLISAVLSSLFTAVSARKKLNFHQFHFTHIELELSILPSVMLKFRPSHSSETADGDRLLAVPAPPSDQP